MALIHSQMRRHVINKSYQVIGSKKVMSDLAIASTSAMESGGETQSNLGDCSYLGKCLIDKIHILFSIG